ncbi:MAG: putative zinc-binding metallopeptidase [Gammaproteobacteria bacterium]
MGRDVGPLPTHGGWAGDGARVFYHQGGPDKDQFQHCLSEWAGVMVMLNELNRSVGQYDAYPFFLSERCGGKRAPARFILPTRVCRKSDPTGPKKA